MHSMRINRNKIKKIYLTSIDLTNNTQCSVTKTCERQHTVCRMSTVKETEQKTTIQR